jgi:hypothetical protein
VSGNDDVKARGARVNERAMPAQFVDLLQVVKYVNAYTLQLQREIERDLGRPRGLVVISSDRVDRGYSAQFFEDLGPADVSRVDDVPDTRKRSDCFRAKQPMRI